MKATLTGGGDTPKIFQGSPAIPAARLAKHRLRQHLSSVIGARCCEALIFLG
jgi:hypothetical protein